MRLGFESIHSLFCAGQRALRSLVVGGLMLGSLAPGNSVYAQKDQSINAAPVQRSERFQGSTTVKDATGKPRVARLAIRHWTILGEQSIPEFQEKGFLLVQLLGGKVTTVIDGKEQKRSKGEFWAVPANSKMSVHATGETATLEVTILNIS